MALVNSQVTGETRAGRGSANLNPQIAGVDDSMLQGNVQLMADALEKLPRK